MGKAIDRRTRPVHRGDSVKRGPLTKTGNRRARRVLVEAAWSYRHPPRVGRDLQPRAAHTDMRYPTRASEPC